jgi:hypothetical protein
LGEVSGFAAEAAIREALDRLIPKSAAATQISR